MTVYRMPKQHWVKWWMGYYLYRYGAYAVMLGFGMPLVLSFTGGIHTFPWAFAIRISLIMAVILLIVAVSGSKSRAKWRESYTVTLDEDGISSHGAQDWNVNIPYTEIAELVDSPVYGLVVKADEPSRGILIYPDMIGAAEIRQHLAQVKPVQPTSFFSADGWMGVVYDVLLFICLPLMTVPVLWIALPAIIYVGVVSALGLWQVLKFKVSLQARINRIIYQSILCILALVALSIQIVRLAAMQILP
jgi:hypothetical protein